ncbi:MAG: hypothetical protein ACI8P3_001872 [Saprospiraceae bacterium]|jgi:hypothetical protein
MKNIIISTLTLVFLAITTITYAQDKPDIGYKKGDIEVALGVGLMNTFIDKNTKAPIPPLSLTIGYRIQEAISIGTYLGYSKTNYVAPPQDGTDIPTEIPEMTNNYFQIGIRGGGHYTQDRLDFYGGAMIGYNFSINKSDNLSEGGVLENAIVDDYSDIVIFSGHIGLKYLLSEHFGIYGEVGYGVSIFNVGVTTRF